MIILLIWVVVLVAVVVLYFRQLYSTFTSHGIKYIKPIPVLGNMGKILFRMEYLAIDYCNLYNSFSEERFVGRFEFLNEMIVIRDIELVKKITVKDFEHFINHRNLATDSFFGRTLFFLQGQEWKDMRSTLSPAFTSSKIRLMVPFMVEVGDQMIRALKAKIKASGDGYVDIECRDLTTRYSNDVIATCAFGLKVDSQTEQNNEFYVMGKTATNLSFRQIIMLFFLMISPKLIKLLKWDLINDVVKKFFTNLVLDTMKDRERRHIIRPDMIYLLMEAKKGKLSHEDVHSNDDAAGFATVKESSVGKKEINREWKNGDFVSQAFLFFFAGFETVSTSMSFLMYELAVNPDVQERLVQEIREHDAKNGGKFDFNSIQSMPYMDMVVSESLRRWPPVVAMDRVCDKDYNMGKPNEATDKDFILRKGSVVMVPTFAFHNDPKYFPEPEKFDPERFSEENKHKINPLAYMPFGVGPRNCIGSKTVKFILWDFVELHCLGTFLVVATVDSGFQELQWFENSVVGSRFALCEVKVMAYQLLRQMELSPCEKTCIPAKLATDNFNLRLQGGHWLRFRMRK